MSNWKWLTAVFIAGVAPLGVGNIIGVDDDRSDRRVFTTVWDFEEGRSYTIDWNMRYPPPVWKHGWPLALLLRNGELPRFPTLHLSVFTLPTHDCATARIRPDFLARARGGHLTARPN